MKTIELVLISSIDRNPQAVPLAGRRRGKHGSTSPATAGEPRAEPSDQPVGDSRRLIALTPTGKLRSSPKLASWLQKRVEVYGRLALLIGGPLGFSDEVLAACDEQISLSPLTFPHELARILLLEQLYRACTILAGEQYHK